MALHPAGIGGIAITDLTQFYPNLKSELMLFLCISAKFLPSYSLTKWALILFFASLKLNHAVQQYLPSMQKNKV
ncbi:hypothetical protein EDI28_06325 [Photobacterium chitinilyticum]|uniref:Uncharacterized protein n=1 Tax=Photobacterium chitinilyticum TaxID=2485123 RepID=A0A3S4TQH7_9GAMM|nr:hypothetical protein EDI28_06325 [Photobacterium chitinilyticum]